MTVYESIKFINEALHNVGTQVTEEYAYNYIRRAINKNYLLGNIDGFEEIELINMLDSYKENGYLKD